MVRSSLAGLLAVVTFGCSAAGNSDPDLVGFAVAAPEAPPDQFRLEWSDDVRPAFFAAIARWGAATGLAVLTSETGAPVIPQPLDELGCSPGAHACVNAYGRIFIRQDFLDTPNEEVTYMHEIGHLMLAPGGWDGAAHHLIPGVMHEWWVARDTGCAITPALLDAVCAVRECTAFAPECE